MKLLFMILIIIAVVFVFMLILLPFVIRPIKIWWVGESADEEEGEMEGIDDELEIE